MSNIDIRRFVDINIIHNAETVVNSTRDTVVLLTTEGTKGTVNVFDNIVDLLNTLDDSTYPNANKYASIYFNNGGAKIKVIEGIQQADLVTTIASLDMTEIVVAYTGSYDDIKSVAKTRETNANIYGINQKILLGRTNADDEDSVKNFAVKYSNVVGAEMTIAAYLSTININNANAVKDYSFTKENIEQEPNDDEVLGKCLENNMNVDMYLASSIMNLGGNLKDGLDLTNEYVLIILQQTITEKLLNLLTEKLAGSSGVNKIKTAISSELGRYANCGYLSLDKSWGSKNKNIVYNNKTYTVIEANTPLILGYHIFVVPLNDLSEQDKALHKCPPIYLILADRYGIRAVTINGEVI